MKNKLIILFSSFIVTVIVFVITLKVINNKKIDNIIEDVNKDIVNKVDDFYNHINKYRYTNTGSLNINAKYKGAHGEAYPANYLYDFELINGSMYIGDETGYGIQTIDKQIINIINKIEDINYNNNFIKIVKKDNIPDGILLTLDNELFNKVFNTKYQNINLKINIDGFIKKLNNYILTLDNIVIKVDDLRINIKESNNQINIILNKNGYSLVLNDKLKMNVFYLDNKNQYNIVINNKVILVETKENEIYLVLSNEAAIYHSLELIFKFGSSSINKDIKYEDMNVIPLIRYLKNIDFN